jgi:very-short-patch-repair endonuclease
VSRGALSGPRRSRQVRRETCPAETWAREAAASKRRALEDRLALQILAHALPTAEREYRFDPVRRWRFDFAWPDFRLAVEVDGGTWSAGRHSRGPGFEADAEKLNAATALGWRVFRYTGTHVRTGYAVSQISVELERAAWNRIP